MSGVNKRGLASAPVTAPRQVATDDVPADAIDQIADGLGNVNSPIFHSMQLGIICAAASCFWWWGVYMFSDDYNDANPYIPSIPVLLWLTCMCIFYCVDFFREEYRVVSAAPTTVAGIEKLFTVDRCNTILRLLSHIWFLTMFVILVGYLTYYHHDFHVLGPALLWGVLGGTFVVLAISNYIRRYRELS